MTVPRKVLIVQTAFAGDVVLAIPLAKGAKQLFPEAEVHFLVKPDTAVLLRNNPSVDRVWIYDKRGSDRGIRALWEWVGTLRSEGFDLAFVPHRSIRSALLVWGARIRRRVSFDRSAGFLLFTDVVPYPADIHEVDRNFRLLRTVGWQGNAPRPELFPGTEEMEVVDEFFGEVGIGPEQPVVAVAPGSVWPTKRWLSEGFAGVVETLWRKRRVRSILVGGEGDIALGAAIAEKVGSAAANAVGWFSLLASAEVIRRCRVILTNDTAPLHLAVAVGTPVVAVFGPTVPAFGFAPYGAGHTVIQRWLACRPCAIHGGKRCPEKHFRCMREISSEEVVRVVEGYLD